MFRTRKKHFSDSIQEQLRNQVRHAAKAAERLSEEHLRDPAERFVNEHVADARDKADQLLDLLKETRDQWGGIGDKEMKQISKYSDELVKLLENKKKRVKAAMYAFEHPNPRPQPGMWILMLVVGLATGYWLRGRLTSSDESA